MEFSMKFDSKVKIQDMRSIGDRLLERLTKGDLASLLEYVKTDKDLRLEVRRGLEASIYYRKGLALGLKNLTVNNESEYFKRIKQSIDDWTKTVKFRPEFDTQQNIARYNQESENRYIILDMEYSFEQHQIQADKRERGAGFDLLGIERQTGKIILFEVKRGLKAIKGRSGINEHINDFDTYINGTHSEIFRNNLVRDIRNIVSEKLALGLISNYNLPNELLYNQPEHIFVFHPENTYEIEIFKRELQGRKKLILVSDDNYTLL
jgi:hypothetical protein